MMITWILLWLRISSPRGPRYDAELKGLRYGSIMIMADQEVKGDGKCDVL